MSSKVIITCVFITLGISPVYTILNTTEPIIKREELLACRSENFRHSHLRSYRKYIDQQMAWLDLGDKCNLTEKITQYQEVLEIVVKDNRKVREYDEKTELEGEQMHEVCDAMLDIINEGYEICNSSALLYCKPIGADGISEIGTCHCLDEFEEDNYGFKDLKAKNCVLKGDDLCGASWRRTAMDEIKGFPESSPDCDTQRCVKNPESKTEEYICTDDEVGLTLLLVIKDNIDVIGSGSPHSFVPTSVLLLLGWIGISAYALLAIFDLFRFNYL